MAVYTTPPPAALTAGARRLRGRPAAETSAEHPEGCKQTRRGRRIGLTGPKLPTSLGLSQTRAPFFVRLKVPVLAPDRPHVVSEPGRRPLRPRDRRPAAIAAVAFLPVFLLLACVALIRGQVPTAPTQEAPRAVPAREAVAEGITLLRWSDSTLLSPVGPVTVQMLRLDPDRTELRLALAADPPPGKATVLEIAARHRAIAAINAGFFVVATGAPAGLLTIDHRLRSATELPRGAVGILPRSLFRPMRLVFDQTAARRPPAGRGNAQYVPRRGTSPRTWARARDVVGGAGLLVHEGRELTEADWAPEKMREAFTTDRHPRTMIGVDAAGWVWLVTVDGRNPALSLGMTFAELQGLARRLGLRNALNLDGGGSTTMVVRGAVVNHPSDPSGPRPISDALLVYQR